jgi:hypothetical protein
MSGPGIMFRDNYTGLSATASEPGRLRLVRPDDPPPVG